MAARRPDFCGDAAGGRDALSSKHRTIRKGLQPGAQTHLGFAIIRVAWCNMRASVTLSPNFLLGSHGALGFEEREVCSRSSPPIMANDYGELQPMAGKKRMLVNREAFNA